jgi:pilus assembly protein Flp/PilA
MRRIGERRRGESGASAVEYGLLVAAIAAVIVLIVFAIGRIVSELFTDTCTSLSAETSISGTCS